MKPVASDVQFPKLEKEILDFWEKNQIIEKGLEHHKPKDGEKIPDNKKFVFYDGPPFATGLPHYGHILAGTLKDIVPRYWVMKGRYVKRRWGWDCHGVPVEFEVENELGLKGLHDIQKFGVDTFNEECRKIVVRYTAEWEKTIKRCGRWADFKNAYRTMDPPFMESVWSVVKKLFDKGLVYEGYRVMPYSWRISTPLSNFEANLNYKSVQDPAITVRMKSKKHKRSLLVWTTTPWTLPSNLAVAVGKDIEYLEIETATDKERLVVAKSRVGAYFKKEEEYTVISTFTGDKLVGETYEPLFPYYKSHKDAFRVVLGHHVTTEDGTGLVHMAPAFGEDDMLICQEAGIEPVNPVDESGNFNAEVPDYQGQNVKEADKIIIKDLKNKGLLFHHGTVVHNYPFCWRSDTPLIYRAISTWFVKLDDDLKRQLVKNNTDCTHWVPEHIQEGRFGNWLVNARDWNISRNRFWGTPIPIWETEDKKERLCVGSVAELEKLSGRKVTDLHKHLIDDIVIKSPKSGKPMKRIPEVLDCWFESGSMPYGQAHYLFDEKSDPKKLGQQFTADFIAEGLDQTRGWFYTLSVLGNLLIGQPPFKNVIVNGLVLAEDGKKMSKRLKNYPEPTVVLDKYGADALRAYLTTSPASRAEELRFSEKGIQEIIRSVLLPYWNAYSFFVTYALADGWDPEQFSDSKLDKLENDLDRWVVSRFQSLVSDVETKMENYHLYEVIPHVLGFIDELTNWYIRLNRRRFWKEDKGNDKEAAYQTLYYVLSNFTKMLAPILPFVTEEIYQNLKLDAEPQSVHLCAYPEVKLDTFCANDQLYFPPIWIYPDLENQMDLVRKAVEMGRNLRSINKIKTRQPLRSITVVTKDPDLEKTIKSFGELIKSELNVHEVIYASDESKYVTLSAKPNAKVLGPKLGPLMKQASGEIRQMKSADVLELEATGHFKLPCGALLALDDILIERTPQGAKVAQSAGGITVLLDTQLDDALIQEGQARELVNRIQKLRKDSGFEVTDRIRVQYHCPAKLEEAVKRHRDYIMSEVLATEMVPQPNATSWTSEQEIDSHPLKLHLEKQ
ncbi:MAG: isoleucine--tRNA ligase [Bdellovibrionales bacterium]|nr:isoleucine--tRNA ligase [Bdellovibrionales bacterium]